jgi:hypothetical protein
MEGTKKLSMPSGNVHDIRYLYTVIAALKQRSGRVEGSPRTFEYFRKAINDYNDAKAGRYGLSFKPTEVNIEVVKHVVAELKGLKLIRSENKHLVLSNDGENVALLIGRRDSDELKQIFARLMLGNYNIFESFLKRLKEISGSKGLPVPVISSGVFDRCEEDPIRIAEGYINIIKETCPELVLNPERLHGILEEANIASLGKRTEKIKRIESITERYVIAEAFSPSIKSRRVYDFVRSRTSFLEFTNYAIFDFEGFKAEVTYLISDFKPAFVQTVRAVEYANGSIYINHPSFEEILEPLKDSIIGAYNAKKDEFGYARIADVRDLVCRELIISDNLFDAYLKRLYQEEPHWLSFTYSGAGDIITEKCLPIVFEKPVRELFTLLRINQRR